MKKMLYQIKNRIEDDVYYHIRVCVNNAVGKQFSGRARRLTYSAENVPNLSVVYNVNDIRQSVIKFAQNNI